MPGSPLPEVNQLRKVGKLRPPGSLGLCRCFAPRRTASRMGLRPCDWRAGPMVWDLGGAKARHVTLLSPPSCRSPTPTLRPAPLPSTPPTVHRSFCCYCYLRFQLRVRCTALLFCGLFALCSSRMSCQYPRPHIYRLVSCSVITPAPNSAIQLA